MHVIAEDLSRAIKVPVLHIADATASAIADRGLKRVGLLGTKFTMEMDFFTRKLEARQIETIIPPEEDREFIHATIFDELGKGIIREATKRQYLDIIRGLTKQGVQGVILGCSEIPLLIEQRDCTIPLFDTVAIHVEETVRFALRDAGPPPGAGGTGKDAGVPPPGIANPPAAR
jgi:aspartate racemase